MPLILHTYDPDADMKARVAAAINHLRVVGLSMPAPEVPPDDEPIRAALARKRWLMKRKNP